MAWQAAVITVSDGAAAGERVDESGPVIAQRLRELPADVVRTSVVPDGIEAITAVAHEVFQFDLAIFTGGTGLGPRDVTPQALAPLLDYEMPGIAEAMRAAGLRRTPHAMLSRQFAGVSHRCLVLALPGSVRAVRESLDAVWPALPHAMALLQGETTHHPPAGG